MHARMNGTVHPALREGSDTLAELAGKVARSVPPQAEDRAPRG